MFRKAQFAIMISCISASSYAYIVGANLTIENKTDASMVITIDQPNKQNQLVQPIPAHSTNLIHLENGDSTGLLYQTATASFKIKEMTFNGKVYVQGRVAYYVGASMWNKYSFLNEVTPAEGLKLDLSYSCRNGGYGKTFENKIVIDGTPGNEIIAKAFPSEVSCNGLKSSTWNSVYVGYDRYNTTYIPICTDGSTSTFAPIMIGEYTWKDGLVFKPNYCNGAECYYTPDVGGSYDNIRNALDKLVGKAHCGSW